MIEFSIFQHTLHQTTRKINVEIESYFVFLRNINLGRQKIVLKCCYVRIYIGFCYVGFVVLPLWGKVEP